MYKWSIYYLSSPVLSRPVLHHTDPVVQLLRSTILLALCQHRERLGVEGLHGRGDPVGREGGRGGRRGAPNHHVTRRRRIFFHLCLLALVIVERQEVEEREKEIAVWTALAHAWVVVMPPLWHASMHPSTPFPLQRPWPRSPPVHGVRVGTVCHELRARMTAKKQECGCTELGRLVKSG